jgi:glucokinase
MRALSPVPLAFPRQSAWGDESILVLAGDVGGTKTNLAIYQATADKIEVKKESTFQSASYESCMAILKQFLDENPSEIPTRICLGVAGPVLKGKVELTNLSWTLDAQDILRETGVTEVSLINDLEATSYGLAALGPDDLLSICESGTKEYLGNMAILAPGTGLGEAGLFWDGKSYHPFSTEGGHTDFAPRTQMDVELHGYLQAKYQVVSWERVIAGPGVYDIYQFLCDVKGRQKAAWLQDSLIQNDPSAIISQMGLEEQDSTCVETMQLYVRYLARESSNLVLKMKATGGLFLGGGIPPKITPLLQQNNFYDNFLDCDRMQHLLKEVSVKILLNDKTALLGAGYFAAYGSST